MEQVLTVKREYIAQYLPRKGVTAENCDRVIEAVNDHHEFIPRPEAENDPSRKQIIPYVVLTRGDQVFAMRRLKKGGEARLHGLLSLGVGGHINPDDERGGNVLLRGLQREIDEEVFIERSFDLVPRGMINDDTQEVGSVHLGLFYTLEVAGEVRVKETEKLEGLWIPRSELPSLTDSMESWSQFVAELLCSGGKTV